jgi:putrescine aminotransferase
LSKLMKLEDGLNLDRNQIRELYQEYVNPGLAGLLALLDLDKHFVRAEGALVWDEDGNEYQDFIAGFGALNLGHNPPAVLDAVELVKGTPVLLQTSLSKLSAVLAHNLAQLAPGDLKNCFFCNSGSEAIEAALKLARAATGRQRLVYCDGSFHGKTFGALSVSSGEFYSKPFGPLLPECQKIPFDDTVALEMVLRDERAACFVVEPIQVEGGIVIPTAGYLKKAREICSRYGTLLVVDESQTGMGRCGAMFACELEEVVPDVICLGRSLGAGVLPVAGLITTADLWELAFGGIEKCLLHSSTYGGNCLGMAAAIGALHEIVEQELPVQAREKGAYLMEKLKSLAGKSSLIKDVRGAGLLIGVEFAPLPQSAREQLADEQSERLGEEFLVSLVAGDLLNRHRIISAYTLNNPYVLRVEPPLSVSYEQMDKFAASLEETLDRRYTGAFTTPAQPAAATFLIVAHDDAFAPWAFLQEGSSMGISVDIFNELARQKNITVKYIGATWANIFPLLTNKQIDLIVSAGWPNPYYDDFPVIASEPYARFETHLFLKRDPADPRVSFRLEDIRGKRVGVQRTGVVSTLLKKNGAEVIEYDNDTLSFLDHFWNKTDLVSAEKMVGLALNQTYFQGCFQVVSEPISKMDVVCLAHKDNAGLIEMINEEIRRFKSSTQINDIYEKYNNYSGPRKVESRLRVARP